MKIELIYDQACPNVELTRKQLRRALAEAGISSSWVEWDREGPDSPDYARRFGSPTVLVNEVDVEGLAPSSGENCCRVYLDQKRKIGGVPPIESITAALLKASEDSQSGRPKSASDKQGRLGSIMAVPALGSLFLPGLTCPACWPGYMGLLSSMGIGFVNYTPYLLPMTVGLLIVAVASLAYKANLRRGFRPFQLGFFGASLAVTGRFFMASDPLYYAGIALLVGAAVWNAWPKKPAAAVACAQCTPPNAISNK